MRKTRKQAKVKARRSKRKIIPKTQPKPERPSRVLTDSFLTESDAATIDAMFRFNSVKAVCEERHISASRYYGIMERLVRIWKMSRMTDNRLLRIYKRARNEKNLLARHLTEVRRVAIAFPIEERLEGEISEPVEAESV